MHQWCVKRKDWPKLKCKPNPRKNPPDCIKSVDPTTLTTCSKVLLQQRKWVCHAVLLYSTAYDAYPTFDLFPIDYGYKLRENGQSSEMHWYDGNKIPDSIEKLEIQVDEGNKSNGDDVDVDDSDSENEDEFDDTQI